MRVRTRQRGKCTTGKQTRRLFSIRSATRCEVFRTDRLVQVVSRLHSQNKYSTVLQRSFAQGHKVWTQSSEHQEEHDHRSKRTNRVGHQAWFEETHDANTQ